VVLHPGEARDVPDRLSRILSILLMGVKVGGLSGTAHTRSRKHVRVKSPFLTVRGARSSKGGKLYVNCNLTAKTGRLQGKKMCNCGDGKKCGRRGLLPISMKGQGRTSVCRQALVDTCKRSPSLL